MPQNSEAHQAPHFPALTTEGIFRRSANTQVVREVQQKYNMGEWPGVSSLHVGAGVEGGGVGGRCVTVRSFSTFRCPINKGPRFRFCQRFYGIC